MSEGLCSYNFTHSSQEHVCHRPVFNLPFSKAIGRGFYQRNLQGMDGQWILNNVFGIMFPKAHVTEKN